MALKFNVLGRDMGSVIKDAMAAIDGQVKPPDGHFFVWGGEFENQQRAMARLQVIVPVAITVVLALLYSALGSARSAVSILLVTPFAVTGGAFGLFLSGIHLSVSAAIGFIALLGQMSLAGLLILSVGIPNWLPEAAGELRPHDDRSAIEDLWRMAEASLPAVDAAERREKAAEAAVEVASRERWPVPVVSVGGLGTTDPAGIAVGFGLSLPLPLFDRGQGAMAKARAEALSARRNREAVLA
jgi:cobalt-zinc-cadmium resistance protein CzcA